jgi:hypothetical protein
MKEILIFSFDAALAERNGNQSDKPTYTQFQDAICMG